MHTTAIHYAADNSGFFIFVESCIGVGFGQISA